jgi:hypothetical protein
MSEIDDHVRAANDVSEAVKVLNDAIKYAVSLGLNVEVETIPYRAIGAGESYVLSIKIWKRLT